jgi:hypothetical protein
MIDFDNSQSRIGIVDQEDRALLRSNPSAWSMPEDGQGHVLDHMLLPSYPSFGLKAINLLSWCSAPTKAKHMKMCLPVGHMSVCSILFLLNNF